MKLSEMKQILASSQIRLTKSLGQNFLHDANQLQRILRAAELTRSDQVLEIGPGLGPLTQLLLDRAPKVLAIEIDRRLFEYLRDNFADRQNLALVHADALEYLRAENLNWTDWKVVANLPYSVASPILVELAQSSDPPKRIVATLQLEVAQKLTALAGAPDYGVLTLLIQLRYVPKGWFRVPAGCFFPEPDVDSGCVTLERRLDPLLPKGDEAIFEKIVKRGFSQRRKMMLKLLKEDWPLPHLQDGFHELRIAENTRAEDVALEQFVGLTRLLSPGHDQGA